MEDIENIPAPQRLGINPPTVDPRNNPMYMKGRGFMLIVYNGYE